MMETTLFIDGEERLAKDGANYAIHNPARPSELVGHAASAGIAEVDDAMLSAQTAFATWSATSLEERAAYLAKVANTLNGDDGDVEMRTRLFTQEHGKTLFETTIEINRLADRFAQVAGFVDAIKQEDEIKGALFDTIVTRHARGVVTLIVPWNWPLAILGSKLPQALLAGNTVVIKLSEQATLAPALTIIKIANPF